MVLAFAGTISAIMYSFFDYTLRIPVFAVYSSFLATKYFTSFKTNFFDELTLLLLISGLALIVFTKEKNETEDLDSFRLRAFFSVTESDRQAITQYFMNPASDKRIVVFGHTHDSKIVASDSVDLLWALTLMRDREHVFVPVRRLSYRQNILKHI